jgi:hypothetical protein
MADFSSAGTNAAVCCNLGSLHNLEVLTSYKTKKILNLLRIIN